MSEKQFTTDFSDFLQNDKTFIKRGNERLTYEEIVDLLNEQDEKIKELKKENKRLAKNLKVAKNNVDANFKSAQYWRQKFEAIPENIRMVWTE